MFVADDITNELDYEEDSLKFSSCKVLLIDHDNSRSVWNFQINNHFVTQ